MRGLMMDLPLSIPGLLRRAETCFSHKEVITRRPDRRIARRTYGECVAGARRLASALDVLGIPAGARVATFCWNHHEHLEAYYAVPASGRVLHTLNIRLHPDELAYIVTHADDALLIVDKVLWPAFEPLRARIGDRRVAVIADDGDVPPGTIDYRSLVAAQGESAPFEDLDEDTGAVLCYTSGTTGRSKGVLYSHRSLVLHSMGLSLPDVFCLGETARVLAVVPMFHANAWGLPFACAMTGATQVLPGPHLDAASIVELLDAEQVTHAAGVPTIWHALLKYLDEHPERHLSSLGILLVGGAAIPEATIRAFQERHGLKVVHAWGMTETSPLGSASHLPSELAEASPDVQYAWRARQGRPAPLVEIRARGETGTLAPWDDQTMGELEIRGPWVAGGYYPGNEAPDRWTEDGWFKTGDIVTIEPSGCISIQDRAKDLVKSGGEWISTVALESLLAAHPGIAEAVVVAVPHARWCERPLAVIVPRPGHAPTLEEIRSHLQPHVAKWWLPDGVVHVESLPKTGTGKYQKHVVRQQYKDFFAEAPDEARTTTVPQR
jgi:fatty-acyl-CoA synthase